MQPAPAHAVLIWLDSTSVYLELPCLDGTFHRLSFPLSEAGLSRALNLLRSRPKPESPLPPARTSSQYQSTADQRAKALRFLQGARV